MNLPPMELAASSRILARRLTREGYPLICSESILSFKKKTFPKCFIQLGRYGDLLIVLRALRLIYEWTGERPKLIVSHSYADILDGFSYVDPIVVQNDWYMGIPDARAIASSMFPGSFSVLQCFGHNWGDPNQTHDFPNFMAAMWHRTGVPMEHLETAPLIVDRRDKDREAKLLGTIKRNGRPMLLYNFKGVSSPFHAYQNVQSMLLNFRNHFQLVDLATIKGQRMYDLLGVFDAAAGMITIDTGTLHLAHASKIPVMAFTVDTTAGGWTRSTAIPNQIFACPYRQVIPKLQELSEVLRKLADRKAIRARMFHCFSDYMPSDLNTRRRMDMARKSWHCQPWTEIPIKDSELPRMFSDNSRSVPYIRDILDTAVKDRDHEDIVILSNSDIHMRSDICQHIERTMKQTDACYCFRRDFHHPITEPIPDAMFTRGVAYAGSDLYAFKVKWWVHNRRFYPDMLCGTEAWDAVMRVLIERTNPGRIVLLRDLIAHERHGSFWENPGNRYSVPSQRHNIKLAWDWFTSQGINPQHYGLRKIE